MEIYYIMKEAIEIFLLEILILMIKMTRNSIKMVLVFTMQLHHEMIPPMNFIIPLLTKWLLSEEI